MAWSFRKRIKIAPGVNINLSKSGVSTSIGPKRAKLNFGPNGTSFYTSIPGTGLYYRKRISKESNINDEYASSSNSYSTYKLSEGDIFCGCLGSWPHFLLWGGILFLCYLLGDGIVTLQREWWEIALFSILIVGFLLLLWKMNGGNLLLAKERSRFRTILWVSFSILAVVSLYAANLVLNDNKSIRLSEESVTEENVASLSKDPSNSSNDIETSDGSTHGLDINSPVSEEIAQSESFKKESDLLVGSLSSLFLISIVLFLTRKKKHKKSSNLDTHIEKDLVVDHSKSFVPDLAQSSEDNSFDLEEKNDNDVIVLPRIDNRDDLPLFVFPENNEILDLISLRDHGITKDGFKLPIALGLDADGMCKIIDLAECPNLFIAGSRACYPSILQCIKTIIYSLLTTRHPSEVKFVLMDAQGLEFMSYQQLINHYLAVLPSASNEEEELEKSIVTNLDDVNSVLRSLCVEMDSRFDLLKKAKCRTIEQYNEKYRERHLLPTDGHRFLPYMIIIINEFAEFTSTEKGLKKSNLENLSQLARKGGPAGCHIVLSTTQLRIDAITKEVKEQFPRTVSFKVPSWRESTFLLGESGAETLNQSNSFIYSYNDGSPLHRFHTIDIKDDVFESVITSIADQRGYKKSYNMPYYLPDPDVEGGVEGGMIDLKDIDERFEEAARMVIMTQRGSTSDLQRKLGMGYAKAGRVMDQLEAAGIVGPQQGSKPREVLVKDFCELDGILSHILK